MSSGTTRSLKTTLAANIKLAQAEKSLTTEETARRLGVTTRLVHKWRAGDHAPLMMNLERLAELCDKSVDWFFVVHEVSNKGQER